MLVPSRGDTPPVSALAETLCSVAPGLEQAALAQAIRTRPLDAASAVAQALAQKPPRSGSRIALLIDQLEELLLWSRERTHQVAAEERELFAEMLGHLARSGAVWVIATLRSDLLTLLDDSPALSQLVRSDRMYRLERPSRAALHEIVRRPAQVAGLVFAGHDQDGVQLADILVEAGANSPDSLPLLQFVLERLFDRDGWTGTIRYDTYARIGGLTNAIGAWAEATVEELGDDRETAKAVDDLILELGRPDGESGSIIARTAVLDEGFLTPARSRAIEALTSARLLILDTVGGHRTARVAHEALLTHWPRSQALFAFRKHALEQRERLKREAKEWRDENEDPACLIRSGPRLTAAEHLLAEGPIHLPDDVRAFIAASSKKSAHDLEVERQRQEAQLAESMRRREHERLRLAADRQKFESHLLAREFEHAAAVLDHVVDYLDQADTQTAGERPQYRELHRRAHLLAAFFIDFKQAFSRAGEEDFSSARTLCERALKGLGVLDDPRWWEHMPTVDLDTEGAAYVKHEAYRLLLLYCGLQLVPGIVALFSAPSPGTGIAPSAAIARLVRFLPDFVLSTVMSSAGAGALKLPRRQDKPAALLELQKSADALLRVRQYEEALAAERGTVLQHSRTSHVVAQLLSMLQELASGPKGALIDYRAWFRQPGYGKPPEPVGAADHFYIGLFNYFVAIRGDGLFSKIIRLLRGRFPDLDGRSPFRTAERLLRASIALEPHSFWPNWVLGRTLMASGDDRGAELAFNAAIAVQPRYARGYEQRALALARQWMKSKEPSLRARAEADSATALTVAGGDPSVYWPRGELLELLERRRQALHAYSRWLELEENVLAKISRGTGIVHLGKLTTQILRGAPGAASDTGLLAGAHALRALIHLTLREDGDALKHAQAAIAIDPDQGHALTVNGIVHFRQGNLDIALEMLNRALTSDRLGYLAALYCARTREGIRPDEAALAAWRALKAASAASVPESCPLRIQQEAEVAETRLTQPLQPAPTAKPA